MELTVDRSYCNFFFFNLKCHFYVYYPTGLQPVLNYVLREATRLDDPVGSMMHPIGAECGATPRLCPL